MTRRLPPSDLNRSKANLSAAAASAIGNIFEGSRPWEVRAGRAALYRFRPDLGVSDDLDHELHMCMWWRDDRYFIRVCQLLRHHGIGAQWGGW